MVLFGGYLSIKAVSFLMFSVFAIAATGYALGRITIKGVSLGTAGVFVTALLYGCFFYSGLSEQLNPAFVKNSLKIVENLGLILFVSSVGFIAGPNFFANFKKNFKSYIVLGAIIILAGALTCISCILIGRKSTDLTNGEFTAILTGLFSGALTSTPAFSAAKGTVDSAYEDLVSVGYGISYLFGVIGVVLFVQLIPKIEKANIREEVAKISNVETTGKKNIITGLIETDDFGIMPFALAALIGIFIGSFKFGNFSLTTTGGCLLSALLFAHFGHIGKVSIMPKTTVLKVFREFGLMCFLIGAGVSGGASFAEHFKPIYFIYGILMTTVPMIIGYIFAKYVLKLSMFNNLGSITGGMTSTPALGTLIHVAGTENVASAYAATYPIALILIVICTQLIIPFFS